jgi:2-oxoglutarate ferredoxin oxidoreductase subunit beta
MKLKSLTRKEIQPQWCLGCGLHVIFRAACEAIAELKINPIIVSGIGCTARGAAYFNTDSVHGIHGRAVPLAVGIKQGNPKSNVLVFSGDGDLLSIGLNHLIHSARRNDNITIICNDNEVFGMTGGQVSPTTKLGQITTTTPYGSKIQPINTQKIILSNKNYFYARTSPIFKNHLKKCIKEAVKHNGFSFIEIISPCIINYKRQTGKAASEAFKEIMLKYKITDENRELKNNEFGIVRK